MCAACFDCSCFNLVIMTLRWGSASCGSVVAVACSCCLCRLFLLHKLEDGLVHLAGLVMHHP